jgi:hypothetical protein
MCGSALLVVSLLAFGLSSGAWSAQGAYMTKKPADRERLKERWLSTQELSGGPYRLGAINRHRQFSLLHAAAKARVMGNIEVAHLALRQSKEARTHQWIDRLSPMMLIERRCSDKR